MGVNGISRSILHRMADSVLPIPGVCTEQLVFVNLTLYCQLIVCQAHILMFACKVWH